MVFKQNIYSVLWINFFVSQNQHSKVGYWECNNYIGFYLTNYFIPACQKTKRILFWRLEKNSRRKKKKRKEGRKRPFEKRPKRKKHWRNIKKKECTCIKSYQKRLEKDSLSWKIGWNFYLKRLKKVRRTNTVEYKQINSMICILKNINM